MAKLSLYIKPGKINTDGRIPVFIRIAHKGKEALISSEFNVDPKKIKNGSISDIGLQAEIYAKSLLPLRENMGKIANLDTLSVGEIKNIITIIQLSKVENINFLAFAKEHVKECVNAGRTSSSKNFQHVVNIIEDFIGRDVMFTSELTSEFLKKLSAYLQSPRKLKRINHGKIMVYNKPPVSQQSLNNYIRDLRTMFNACRDKFNDADLGIINIPNYPFKKYKLKPVVKVQGYRAISIEELQRIIALDTEKLPKLASLAKDMYLLSFYLIGVNAGDLYNFTKKNIKNGRLEYQRRKTKHRTDGAFFSLFVNELAKEIMDRYKGIESLLWLNQAYKDKHNCIRAVNKGLQIIAKKCGIDSNNFTWYSARHTWASIARNKCGYSLEDVAAALNHVGDHKITGDYIERDWSIIDRMNQAVMDKVK